MKLSPPWKESWPLLRSAVQNSREPFIRSTMTSGSRDQKDTSETFLPSFTEITLSIVMVFFFWFVVGFLFYF